MKMKNKTRENLVGYSFIFIFIVGFAIFTLYPIVSSFIYCFFKVPLTKDIEMTFVGFDNFKAIFSTYGKNYLQGIKDFVIQVLLRLPIILVFSIIIALLLNQNIRFKGLFRTIFFLPVIISSGPIITELISQGAAGANIISSLGFLETLQASLNPAISEPIIKLFSEIIIVFWFSGVQVLLFLSALQKINKEIYEAAAIDGAGPWEAFWKITMPSLKNIIFINAIYTLVLLATYSENAVVKEIRANMFSNNTGYGVSSVMAWIYFLIIALLLGIIALVFMPRKEVKK